MNLAVLERALAAQRGGAAVVVATRLSDGAQGVFPEGELPAAVEAAAGAALRRGQNGTVSVEGEDWFLHVRRGPVRLVVVGAVHITQALAPMAGVLGIAVTVIDPRPAFNSAERMVGVERVLDWPDAALDAAPLGSDAALVVLAHDPKLDDPALDRALRSEAFYVGALGSRKSHANRLERLRALGHSEEALARVRGPVGLAIGAVSAAEIALSILGELVAVRRGAAGG